jgi:serine protease Do
LEATLRKLWTLLALPALLTIPSGSALAKSDKSRVVKKALYQSVRVEVMAFGKLVAQASGVVVATNDGTSYVLTNAHVVAPALEAAEQGKLTVIVERPRLARVTARLIATGRVPEEDLALLSIERKLLPVSIAADDEVDVGDDVVVVGAPYGRSLSVSSGIVSQLEQEESGAQTAMKTDAAIGYGASGGGVFDVPSGKLVGLVEGYRTARVAFMGARSEELGFDVPMPGETFLAPPTKIRRFLRRAGLAKEARLDPIGLPELQKAMPPHATAAAQP